MIFKTITPESADWMTAMRLLYSYSLAEQKDFYDVVCHAKKRSKIMALYDKDFMLGCLVLFPHGQQIDVSCLLKKAVQSNDEYQAVIKKMLGIMYPEYTVYLKMNAYKIS